MAIFKRRSIDIFIIIILFAYLFFRGMAYGKEGSPYDSMVYQEIITKLYIIQIFRITEDDRARYNIIRINGKNILRIDDPIVAFEELDSEESVSHVYLVRINNGGNNCEGEYIFIDMNDHYNPQISKRIGNCYLPVIFRHGEEIVMMFPTWQAREFEQFRYVRGRLTERVVKLRINEFRKVIASKHDGKNTLKIVQTGYGFFAIELNGKKIKYVESHDLDFLSGNLGINFPLVHVLEVKNYGQCSGYMIVDPRNRDYPYVTDLLRYCHKIPGRVSVDRDDIIIMFHDQYKVSESEYYTRLKYSKGHTEESFIAIEERGKRK
ncbi:MAG: hypothetical protein HQL76_02935 [Magnetococcales bacterium]|nr:hypothetical protein [Magnetococcales bacterium]